MYRWLVTLCFALCICRLAQGGVSQPSYGQDETFLKWCAEFCESESEEYLARIYPTWRANADYVQQQNSLGLPYSLSLNGFAHLSRDEFAKRHLRPSKRARPLQSSTMVHSGGALPTSVDWRTKGVVPPVANQGQCGDPVPYAVVHAVDSLHAIQTGMLELASIEEYIDCCWNSLCEGGFYDEGSYACIVKIGGLALESVYVSPDHECLNDSFKPAIKINGGKFMTPGGNETALAYAVAMQPVVVGIDAGHPSFELYQSGVYYNPDCSKINLDHVVLVVGYGATESGEEYWICQNSWGASWGMKGYVYMARNKNNNCGIATEASYPF